MVPCGWDQTTCAGCLDGLHSTQTRLCTGDTGDLQLLSTHLQLVAGHIPLLLGIVIRILGVLGTLPGSLQPLLQVLHLLLGLSQVGLQPAGQIHVK